MEDINLHFTGDFHAITSANNLICAAVDNHIYFGNSLDIQNVTFHRCLDVNDRALRDVDLGTRHDSFSISSASEIMALFCLATSYDDLRRRLGNIVVGFNSKDKPITVHDLGVEGSLMALLKDAFLPNLVQTLENTPAIIHGGPFANIAHGCNSIMATRTALSMANYVVTEAGFGADLGAEKFLDIKCRVGGLEPNAIVLVSTIKALKYHGGVTKDEIFNPNMEAFEKGFANLDKHYENLKKYGIEVVVCLNRYNTDTDEEIEFFKKHCEEKGYLYAVSNAYALGSEGAMELANKVLKVKKGDFHFLYSTEDSIVDKINTICKEIYGAKKVTISKEIMRQIKVIEKNNQANLPICVAKTQYSFSDDAKKVGVPKDFEVTVKDIRLYGGAEFITVLLGDIMVMPGLSRKPNYELIDVVDGEIINLS
jgi:formate--tetrahydrofolate ligase